MSIVFIIDITHYIQKMPTNKKETTDLKMPKKSDETKDNRYKYPQFTKSDGTRDKRTTPTYKKAK